MTDRIRVIGGFVEINYEPFAQVLPGKDERTLAEEILGHPSEYDGGYNDGYDEGSMDGFAEGQRDGEERARKDFTSLLGEFLGKKKISNKTYALIIGEIDG